MKYRVKHPVRLQGRWLRPGEIVKGSYEPWVYRGFLEKVGAPGTGAAPAADVAVKMNAAAPPPPSSFTQVLEMDDGVFDDEDLDDAEDML